MIENEKGGEYVGERVSGRACKKGREIDGRGEMKGTREIKKVGHCDREKGREIEGRGEIMEGREREDGEEKKK